MWLVVALAAAWSHLLSGREPGPPRRFRRHAPLAPARARAPSDRRVAGGGHRRAAMAARRGRGDLGGRRRRRPVTRPQSAAWCAGRVRSRTLPADLTPTLAGVRPTGEAPPPCWPSLGQTTVPACIYGDPHGTPHHGPLRRLPRRHVVRRHEPDRRSLPLEAGLPGQGRLPGRRSRLPDPARIRAARAASSSLCDAGTLRPRADRQLHPDLRRSSPRRPTLGPRRHLHAVQWRSGHGDGSSAGCRCRPPGRRAREHPLLGPARPRSACPSTRRRPAVLRSAIHLVAGTTPPSRGGAAGRPLHRHRPVVLLDHVHRRHRAVPAVLGPVPRDGHRLAVLGRSSATHSPQPLLGVPSRHRPLGDPGISAARPPSGSSAVAIRRPTGDGRDTMRARRQDDRGAA